MKNLQGFTLAIIATCIMSSCGSSKSTTSTTPGGYTKNTEESTWGTKLDLTESQAYAMAKSSTRAWGDAVYSTLDGATTRAEANARSKMARAIGAKITTATEQSDLSWMQYSGDSTQGNSVYDEGGKTTSTTLSIAQEVVENAVAVKFDQFMQPNRQYHVFVCLEYQGDMSSMKQAVVNKVKQRIPDEERIKMEYQFQQFEEKIQKELENMNCNE